MKIGWLLAIVVIVGIIGGTFYFKKVRNPVEQVDPAYYQSVQGTHDQLQETRTILNEALSLGDLETIHDYMYYLQGTIDVFVKRLDAPDRERLRDILERLRRNSVELDYLAGKNQAEAAKASVEKMFAILDELKAAFEGGVSGGG